jgi:hypothetical protein
VAAGVPLDRLYVDLGYGKHHKTKYHPMLHSKVYLCELPEGRSAAFVGSHNLTGFALHGLNGEAGILLEGAASEPEFEALRGHIAASVAQATRYDPQMKEAYSWWTTEFLDGLRIKSKDIPQDGQAVKTIVVLAACATDPLPKKAQIIYFELPEALDAIHSIEAEVHIYCFDRVPTSPTVGLAELSSAKAALRCTTRGIEMGQGGEELRADWQIDDRGNPTLKRTIVPFRPRAAPGMKQVRVEVIDKIMDNFEYLFDSGKQEWVPNLDNGDKLSIRAGASRQLAELDLVQREDGPWHRITGLRRADERSGMPRQLRLALEASSPESGSFILVSLRRRKKAKGRSERG